MTVDTATGERETGSDAPVLSCRLCGSTSLRSFVDLGATPPCELFLTAAATELPEPTYPLHVRVCDACLLAQLPPLITPEETFTEYAYFSSFSTSWVEHARRYVDAAVERLGLDEDELRRRGRQQRRLPAAELRRAGGIRCLGVEPSINVGEAARAAGVPTLTAFLDETSARACGPSTAPPTWSSPTTSTPTSRTWSGSPRGCGSSWPTTGGCRSRSSTC